MDPRIEMYTAAFGQGGSGLDFPVYVGRSQFGQGFNFSVFRGRGQRGQGIGDLFRGIWRIFRPIVVPGVKTALKSASEAITDGASVKDSNIRTIFIRLCNKTGETINFESGDVICRLNFRRVGLLSGFL